MSEPFTSWEIEVRYRDLTGVLVSFRHSIGDVELHKFYEKPELIIGAAAQYGYESIQKKRSGVRES